MAQCLLYHGWLVLLKTGAYCGLPILFEVTTDWRAGCQKLACPVRREGRPESSSLPLSPIRRITSLFACHLGSRGSASLPPILADHVPFRLPPRIARKRVPTTNKADHLPFRMPPRIARERVPTTIMAVTSLFAC